jgi:predicted transcriptional regulator
MSHIPKRQLGPLEKQLLALLCQRPDATVRELIAAENLQVAYTTVMTTLDRLYKKGFLDRFDDRHSQAFRYRLRNTHRDFYQAAVGADLERLLEAAADPSVPVSFLVDTLAAQDQGLLEELRRAVVRKKRELRRERP